MIGGSDRCFVNVKVKIRDALIDGSMASSFEDSLRNNSRARADNYTTCVSCFSNSPPEGYFT